MQRNIALLALCVIAACAAPAGAVTVSLNPVTITPDFAGDIIITGRVTLAPNEFMQGPGWSHPHLLDRSAGFTGYAAYAPDVLSTIVATRDYTGPILIYRVHPNNLGYSNGAMPLGEYSWSSIPNVASTWGIQTSHGAASDRIVITVVPAPGAAVALLAGAPLLARRRRNG